ncbi:MAG TPA: prephenate dehydrogenase [Dermatophilaceae bacterium]|nr:prephenate dehydrogenase [Dermatophilaceae bacterium]
MRVHIVGTGLIGTSLGLALRRAGVTVTLEDPSPTAAALARDLGAGDLDVPPDPDVVVIAAPPDVAAAAVAGALSRWPAAAVTDAASVKSTVLSDLAATVADQRDLSRYVGSHPMAGRERSGAVAAQVDLFDGRPWVLAPGPQAAERAVAAVARIGELVGSAVVRMTPAEHDAAVAAVSHVPQVAASLVAARLRDLPGPAVSLSGQGIRDVTRIAASDPTMWTQILAGNAPAVSIVLRALRADLDGILAALDALSDVEGDGVGARAVLARAVADGNAGHARIPGKHGSPPTAYASVVVVTPDAPGTLAKLLADVADAGVNLEDLHLEHGIGQPFGLVEIVVVPAAAEPLTAELTARGWRVHD